MAPGNLYRHPQISHRVAYGPLAPLYDRVMSHVDYGEWRDLIMRICNRYFPDHRPTTLEIGAGTGSLGVLLTRAGFPYVGSDFSPGMCRQARAKNLPVFCADGRSIPVSRKFECILFLYDAINYLLLASDYEKLFAEIARCLVDGGIFLFDITTEANSLSKFLDYLDSGDLGDSYYVRHSYYDRHAKMQFNEFTIFQRSPDLPNLYAKHREVHVQKVLPAGQIKRLVPADLFSIEGMWDGYGFQRYRAKSDRVHFLLRKRRAQ
jgi:SAM-dependent methyltransferase